MKRYKLHVQFVEEILGSLPASETVFRDFHAAKALAAAEKPMNVNGATPARIEEEIALLPDDEMTEEEKGRTVFLRDQDGTPLIADYVLRGFFKEAASAAREWDGSATKKLSAHKNKINRHLFIKPRMIRLNTHGKQEGYCDRPLRAETMRGPRVALASSEVLPAGTTFVCDIIVLAPQIITEEMLREWLDYGELSGLGQWRSGGKGTFTYKLVELDTKPR